MKFYPNCPIIHYLSWTRLDIYGNVRTWNQNKYNVKWIFRVSLKSLYGLSNHNLSIWTKSDFGSLSKQFCLSQPVNSDHLRKQIQRFCQWMNTFICFSNENMIRVTNDLNLDSTFNVVQGHSIWIWYSYEVQH